MWLSTRGASIGTSDDLEVEEMNKSKQSGAPRAGDVVEITSHRLGDVARIGEILEVSGVPGHEHFRVRWEDGRESVVYPSSDAVVRPRRTAVRGAR
jgi:hypothetical protein